MAATAERQELQVIERHPAPAPMVAGVGEFSAMAMIAQAVERGAAPEMIDKLFDWQDRIEKKQAVRDFDAAFAQAKGKFPKITKDAHVNFPSRNGGAATDYWHESLAGISEKVDPILAEFGFAYSWEPKQVEGGRIEVTCILSHVGGHSRKATLSGSPDTSGNKNNLQSVASAVSYLERYTLKAVLGIASAYDDDGRGGPDMDIQPDPGRGSAVAPRRQEPPAMKITASQAEELHQKIEAAKPKGIDMPMFWTFAKVEPGKIEDIAADRYPTIMSALASRYGV